MDRTLAFSDLDFALFEFRGWLAWIFPGGPGPMLTSQGPGPWRPKADFWRQARIPNVQGTFRTILAILGANGAV